MKKNILLINTGADKICSLSPLLEALKDRDYNFIIASAGAKIKTCEQGNTWKNIAIPRFFNLNNRVQLFFFTLLSPFIFVFCFLLLVYIKLFIDFSTIICTHYIEKICLTKISRLFKINLVWLEFPEIVIEKRNNFLSWLLKNSSQVAKIICFTEFSKDSLSRQGYKLENISIIAPGIVQKNLQRQENIFGEIAHNNGELKKRKYFTIGIVSELNNEKTGDKFEKVFQAIKKALVVVPNLQIIVVGEGEERKNLGWLTKKMEIDNMIWFVGGPNLPEIGSQKHLKKWLDSFDVLISVCKKIDLNDLQILLHAMASSLPIIGPENIGLETIINNQKNGSLINTDNSDTIAAEIITLQQSKSTRQEYGKKASTTVHNHFTISRMADQFVLFLK
ncbi:MAG: glycosyltransferase [Candidatus Magasanikbacteria bacterium]|nr:glycosyltransferase [Candidatus Magasanikbacteria bacterium]